MNFEDKSNIGHMLNWRENKIAHFCWQKMALNLTIKVKCSLRYLFSLHALTMLDNTH